MKLARRPAWPAWWATMVLLVGWGSLWAAPLAAVAQSETVAIRLQRNFGFAAGGRIQGTFTLHADAPGDVIQVSFYLDDSLIGTDTEPPFALRFQTDSFALGPHTLAAVGVSADGQEWPSNTLQREFVSGGDGRNLEFWIIGVVLALSVGGRLVASYIANRDRRRAGKPVVSGPLGGTICPHCGRPYALHIWGLNLVARRLDRCPHCGKWRLVRRQPQAALDDAADAAADAAQPPDTTAGRPRDLRQQLEESRFDDGDS